MSAETTIGLIMVILVAIFFGLMTYGIIEGDRNEDACEEACIPYRMADVEEHCYCYTRVTTLECVDTDRHKKCEE